MHQNIAEITLRELIYTIIPHLNTAEKLINNTLSSLIEASNNPLDLLKRQDQQKEFALEVQKIRLNLENLLKRYESDAAIVLRAEGRVPGPVIEPDESERQALQDALDIYARVRDFQQGERSHPLRQP
ncbi:hypothetical protein R5M92_10345 [Halomonas sp. Bachu 37]|uniref:hypothetical protein n=1 Tax=Halomonas kashgarensis TaxID=3084920 RepID=UPI0032171642